jgi:predicted nucleic acid-binding protein
VSGSTPKLTVAIDTMTLIWGVRKKGPKDKLEHARNLFVKLDHDEAQIVVPSVVVAEHVTPIDTPEDRAAVIAAMTERFLIEPFDVRDAALAAGLFRYGKSNRDMKAMGARICLRADSLIVATAKNHGAEVFYTEDRDCFAMAQKAGMTAKELPKISDSLFE